MAQTATTTNAEASVEIEAPSERVWAALTDPEQIKQYYMGATVETDWRVGSPITFRGEWQGKPFQDKGEILTVDRGRELRYSHWSPMTGTEDAPENYHVVDITLAEAEGTTTVKLAQSNLEGGVTDTDRKARADYEQNWAGVLDGLKRTVEG